MLSLIVYENIILQLHNIKILAKETLMYKKLVWTNTQCLVSSKKFPFIKLC